MEHNLKNENYRSAEDLVKEIIRTKEVTDDQGKMYPLRAHIDQNEGDFIKEILQNHSFSNTIEIGCAYGISSLLICSAIKNRTNCHHTIIDPMQSSIWKNIGVTNLKKVGFDFYELIEKPSEIALPELLARNKVYDFGFIDGWHTFDHTLIDFFYLNRMVKVGGIIVIDDVGMKSINKLLRYILNYPCYELVGHVELDLVPRRELFDRIVRRPLHLISNTLPLRFGHEVFSGKVIKSDTKLKLKSSMVALKKVKADERTWNWFEDF